MVRDNLEADFHKSDAVFVGTVARVDDWQLPPHDAFSGTKPASMKWFVFDVDAAWSGPGTDKLGVFSSSSIASCGAQFEVGERGLFVARYSSEWDNVPALDGRLYVDSCTVYREATPELMSELNALAPPLSLRNLLASDPSLQPPQISLPGSKGPKSWWKRYWFAFVLPIGLLSALGLALRFLRPRP